jgi:hypothetical protein
MAAGDAAAARGGVKRASLDVADMKRLERLTSINTMERYTEKPEV